MIEYVVNRWLLRSEIRHYQLQVQDTYYLNKIRKNSEDEGTGPRITVHRENLYFVKVEGH